MKFSIGDKIILKQTGEEGHVVAYINAQMLEVEVEGISFPVYSDDIDHPYLKWFTEKNTVKKAPSLPEQLPVEKEKLRAQRLAKGVYLSFMPVFKAEEMEDVVDQLKIYLINELPVPIRFSYESRLMQETSFRLDGALHAFGHLYLHSMEYASMNDQPRFNWQVADASGSYKTEEGVIRIKPSRLFEHINELLLRNEPSFSYLLTGGFVPAEKAPPKAQKEQLPAVRSTGFTASSPKPVKITSLADVPRFELDLHIEQVIDNHKGLSNGQIMDLQMRALERFVHLAIAHRQERIIIIHGLGTGALRDAVQKYLREVPEVGRFANEWQGRYGFGATEVFFRY